MAKEQCYDKNGLNVLIRVPGKEFGYLDFATVSVYVNKSTPLTTYAFY